MNRRQVLVGASALAVSASTVVAQALPEQEYCINPWRQAKSGDAMVKISDIQLAGFISSPPSALWNDHSWLEVWTLDGRFLTTELAYIQSGVHELHATLTSGLEARRKRKDACYTVYKPYGLALRSGGAWKGRDPLPAWERAAWELAGT